MPLRSVWEKTNKTLFAAFVVAVVSLAVAIPPTNVGWNVGNGKYTGGGRTVEVHADFTLWHLATKITQGSRVDRLEVKYSDLESNDEPACDDGSSTPTNADMHLRINLAQGFSITAAAGSFLLCVVGSLLSATFIRVTTPTVIASAVCTGITVIAGVAAIVSYDRFFNGCSVSLCDSYINSLTASIEGKGYRTTSSGSGYYASLPLLVIAMAAAVTSLAMILLGLRKDRSLERVALTTEYDDQPQPETAKYQTV